MNYAFLHEMYKMPVSLVKKINDENDLIEIIKNHFTSNYARNFVDYSNLDLKVLGAILPISMRTFQRELSGRNKILKYPVSETLIEMGEIYAVGIDAFDGKKQRLNEWLCTKNTYFNNKTPLEIMNTHKGRDLVKDELYKIEYSEFS